MNIKLNLIFAFVIFITVIITAQQKSQKIVANSDHAYMAPVWSPDGTMIAFTSSGYKGIWTINLDTKKITQITSDEASGFGFQWSNNSKIILTRIAKYEGFRRYNAVKTFNVKTGESNLLTDFRTSMPGIPQFTSTDDRVFIFGRHNLEIFNSGIKDNSLRKSGSSPQIIYIRNDKIAVQNLITNKLQIFEPVKGERVLNLQNSPDGKKVAFEIIGGNMYVINVDGTGLIDLGKGYRPKWSPDSKYIVYMITEDDGYQILSSDIYSIKTDGTERTNLTNSGDKTEMDPSWSPDGKKIVYDAGNEGAIYIMDIQ
jgi:Tol biopolymer transport system component